MTSFEASFKKCMEFEGEYSNDPQDRGGETYCGIARNFFPKWEGWPYIDDAKKKVGTKPSAISKAVRNIEALRDYVKVWYKKEWWDCWDLDQYQDDVAMEVFEQAVNLGKGGVGKHIQIVCNAFNFDRKTRLPLFEDLVIDNAVGKKTLAAFKIMLQNHDAKSIVHALNCCQGYHYLNLAARKKTQRVFTYGWLKRTYD